MKNYVIVGTGHRGTMAYIIPLTNHFQDCVKLCGIYDKNVARARYAASRAAYPVEVFDDFDKMLETVKPDSVIVTTRDCAHDEIIVKALEFGCDVVSEKPITTTAEKMKAIYEAEKRTGHKVQVTFNCRFMPKFMRVKELLQQGVIGTPFSVHYEWLLDTSHGADYFRRWHRMRENSGSLLIHKSTHHFDLMNWFLDDEPEKVNAFGTRRFYGDSRREHGERCLDCKYKDSCEFYMDITTDELYKDLYYAVEKEDGYYRDRCIFADEINIEDTVAMNIQYKKGALATYSLVAHAPYEGMRMMINGSEGRMEISVGYGSGAYAGDKDFSLKIFNRLGEVIDITADKTETMRRYPRFARAMGGGHGGSDMLLCDMIFRKAENDDIGLLADSRAGAMSIGIGIAANKSLEEKRVISIDEFYDFLK